MRYNITLNERLTAHRNPVFLSPEKSFYNPFDRGFVNNLIEFFMPSWIWCCISSDKQPTIGEIVRKEFPDGIKNSILTKPKNGVKNKAVNSSYEPIDARDSTIENTHDGDEEERKIGDTDIDESVDLRYDIEAICENSICPKFDRSRLYNWNKARFYSVIDIIGHPMIQKAKAVLVKHLHSLQQKEMREEAENGPENDDEDTDSEAEEEEEESEDDEFELHGPGVRQIPGPNKSNQFRQGANIPSKEDILSGYAQNVEIREKYFNDAEKKLTSELEKEELRKEKEAFMKTLKNQRDTMLVMLGYDDQVDDTIRRRVSIPENVEPDAFIIDDDDEDDEEDDNNDEEGEQDNDEGEQDNDEGEQDIEAEEQPSQDIEQSNIEIDEEEGLDDTENDQIHQNNDKDEIEEPSNEAENDLIEVKQEDKVDIENGGEINELVN